MNLVLAPLTPSLMACMALVLIGSAVQVAVGAGLSVICGFSLMLWLGPAVAVPILLCLNLLVSVVATGCDSRSIRWPDAVLAATATIAGCLFAAVMPALPDAVLRLVTAGVLIIVALPRPSAPTRLSNPASAAMKITLASLVTGALTVWTATPGPIMPVAFARAGRSGIDIRRTMQPISMVGYGAALAWVGPSAADAIGDGPFLLLVAATLAGIAAGYALRPRISADRVTLLIRVVAAAAAALLIVSVLR